MALGGAVGAEGGDVEDGVVAGDGGGEAGLGVEGEEGGEVFLGDGAEGEAVAAFPEGGELAGGGVLEAEVGG